ncbi:MAG: 4-hydroxy-tetrahydrodipicolinate reductase [Treponema sp.]|nr:4-hydroxy-tetrahydrodipicolinate reductase [Treponema sp.]
MNIAIIGYGKMGKIVEEIACAQGHVIVAVVDNAAKGSSFRTNVKISRSIAEAENLEVADVAIEFTQPGSALGNIIALAERKIPSVIGTTGWHDKIDEAKKAVQANQSAMLWANNFSIGVNLFFSIAWYAANLVNEFSEFDVGGFEAHHNKKLDSPSGTAKTLVEGVLSRVSRKKNVVWETMNRRPEPDELHYPSLRMGTIPGLHSLFLDSAADTIEITHTARSREGFATGAIRAAQWLISAGQDGEKRRGVFTIDEMLAEMGCF